MRNARYHYVLITQFDGENTATIYADRDEAMLAARQIVDDELSVLELAPYTPFESHDDALQYYNEYANNGHVDVLPSRIH
jgi:hypothetical protein